MIIPSRPRGLSVVAGVAAIGGSFVAFHYHRLGLTLSHYDARGHLIVRATHRRSSEYSS